MNNDTVDLLDLDDGTSVDTLPDATPFAAPRPKKPWLLLVVGLMVIILATYIIIRTISGNDSSSIEVDLDTPVVENDANMAAPTPIEIGGDVTNENVMPNDTLVVPNAPGTVPAAPVTAPQQQVEQPIVNTEPAVSDAPVRVIEDRKEVTFNPDRPAKPVAKRPVPQKAVTKNTAPKTTSSATGTKGSWYVQFGSYSTRAAAEAAQRQIKNAHSALFQGKQFVVLAAVLPNGTTTYRLRIAFATAADANGFCRNAKSDGLDCYVAK